MSRYGITIREILERTVIVEADNLWEAIPKVDDAVKRGEIILNADDFDTREIVPSDIWNGEKILDEEDISLYQHLE